MSNLKKRSLSEYGEDIQGRSLEAGEAGRLDYQQALLNLEFQHKQEILGKRARLDNSHEPKAVPQQYATTRQGNMPQQFAPVQQYVSPQQQHTAQIHLDQQHHHANAQRVNAPPDPAFMVHSLSDATVRALLVTASHYDPRTFHGIWQAFYDQHSKEIAAMEYERNRVIDFWHYVDKTSYVLDVKYSSGKGSVEYERAGDAVEDISGYISEIQKQAKASASYGTNVSALETLIEVGHCILDGGGVIGHEVRKDMGRDGSLPEAIITILETMDGDEIVQLSQTSDDTETFFSKVEGLASSGRSYGLWEEEMERACALLEPAAETDEEEDEDEDDEENAEDEEEEEGA